MEEGNVEYFYNRIVIVGNGLDLAMGLKTSYSDFLLDYLISIIEKTQYERGYKDTLLSVGNTSQTYGKDFKLCKTIQEFIDLTKENGHWQVKYLGILLNIIDNLSIENWVDIESLYFDTMLPMIDNVKKGRLNRRDYAQIRMLNDSFRELTINLDKYIHKIVGTQINNITLNQFYGFLEKCVEKQLDKRICLNHKVDFGRLKSPEKVLFLNFNYTNSINKILNFSRLNPEYSMINIHGQAGNPTNPIIFGYGDDTHPRYVDLEQERSDVPLEFIKSFYYNRTTDYHKMLGFMESGSYEVYIVGHSCGLSDRTLLKSIFEHEDCISIKIFHKGNKDRNINLNEHIRKNMAISRHFDDKLKLRERVLPFDEYAGIPQAKA
ncbi:AbiH family protein [Flagellimonas sediminis]|uniref:Bacteriophage abortive infection AbiH n=1 Tax=Flagellimonas sediminis TaxID=2696468 RepID=A0A6I5KT05_9FLAO|nr:AbiH family protein [Allomuricauda sediminis]NDV43115.1 hypothetical protein [Allomuricauda sediminis]